MTSDSSALWIDTVVIFGAYWRAQRVVAAAIPTRNGSNLTWSWSLPANFPPGICLRVKVDGGASKQSGVDLQWDNHGFYEVMLDAGNLTLSP